MVAATQRACVATPQMLGLQHFCVAAPTQARRGHAWRRGRRHAELLKTKHFENQLFPLLKYRRRYSLPSFPSLWASRAALVATAGCASKSWSERAPGEVRGVAVSVPFGLPISARQRSSSSSSGEASWLAYTPTKQCYKNLLWSARNVPRTALAGTVLFYHIGSMF